MEYIVQRIENPQIIEPIRGFSAVEYINRIIPILILIGFIACVLAFFILLIVGGIQWTTSEGNKQSLENARNKIINAITGLIVLFLLFIIVQFVNLTFGTNLGNVGMPLFPSRPAAPTEAPTTSSGICGISGYSCSCACPENYIQASECNATCSGSCTCVYNGLTPGNCECMSGYPSINICNEPYIPICTSETECACLLPVTPTSSISPFLTPTMVPGHYNLSLIPICENGNTPTIRTSVNWITCCGFVHHTDGVFQTGIRSVLIPITSSLLHLWVGLENYDSLIIPGSNNNLLMPLAPLPTYWGMGTSFNPYSWLASTPGSDGVMAPEGSYTINFEVPDVYCETPITPTPTPATTWILTSGVTTTCNQVCLNAGMSCATIDFDPQRYGGEDQYVDWSSYMCLVASGNCSTPLTARTTSSICNIGWQTHQAAWTFCGCR